MSDRADAFLRLLEAEQVAQAAAALGQPAHRDQFEYGKQVGVYAGLDRAKTIYLKLLNDDEEREKEL